MVMTPEVLILAKVSAWAATQVKAAMATASICFFIEISKK
jgi:hypothetical protein